MGKRKKHFSPGDTVMVINWDILYTDQLRGLSDTFTVIEQESRAPSGTIFLKERPGAWFYENAFSLATKPDKGEQEMGNKKPVVVGIKKFEVGKHYRVHESRKSHPDVKTLAKLNDHKAIFISSDNYLKCTDVETGTQLRAAFETVPHGVWLYKEIAEHIECKEDNEALQGLEKTTAGFKMYSYYKFALSPELPEHKLLSTWTSKMKEIMDGRVVQCVGVNDKNPDSAAFTTISKQCLNWGPGASSDYFIEVDKHGKQKQESGEEEMAQITTQEDPLASEAMAELLERPVNPPQEVRVEELTNHIVDVMKGVLGSMKLQAQADVYNIKLPNKETIEIKGHKHNLFESVLKVLNSGLHLFLVGPAGSGKTSVVEQAAEALGKKFYAISVCVQTSASILLGYMNAEGSYVRTLFREAYEHGGVFLLDEIDNGNPNVLSVLNSALANDYCAFPDKMIKKHPDFILCASGNTYGLGGDRQYVGRLEIDAATLDRFVFLEFNYDEEMESIICGNPSFAKLVQHIRKQVYALSLRQVVSPRASIFGAKLLKAGFDLDTVLKWTVFKSIDQADKEKIMGQDKNEYMRLAANVVIAKPVEVVA